MKRIISILLTAIMIAGLFTVNISVSAEDVNIFNEITLNYTRDVMEARDQYTKDKGTWIIAEKATIDGYTFDEDYFMRADGYGVAATPDNGYKTTLNSIPYQFGVLKSATHGVADEPGNAIHSGDGGTINITVDKAPYNNLYMIAWSGKTDNVAATITYTYTDGTTSTDANLSAITGGTKDKANTDYVTQIIFEKAKYTRIWKENGEKASSTNVRIFQHKLTPNPAKILQSVTITTEGKEINIFALTGATTKLTVTGILDAIKARFSTEKLAEADLKKVETETATLIAFLKSNSVNAGTYETDIKDLVAARRDEIKQEFLQQLSEKTEELKGKINELLEKTEKYVLVVKDDVISINEDYTKLKDNGVEDEDIGSDLVNKFKAIYKQYEDAEAFEKTVSQWTSYKYDMYADVEEAEGKLDDLDGAITEETASKVKEYYNIAESAKETDATLDSLGTTYDKSMLEEILKIEEFIDKNGRDALKNIAIYDELLERAKVDVLNNDITSVQERIEALPITDPSAIEDEIKEIQEEIESIKSRDGNIPNECQQKVDFLAEVLKEKLKPSTMTLNYTRDVMESRDKYISDNATWSIPEYATSDSYAFDEVYFMRTDGYGVGATPDNGYKTTLNNIPYQFGVLKSAVNGVADEPGNVVHSADFDGTMDISVTEGLYTNLYMIAWSGTKDNINATITYKYADGSKEEENNLSAISGGKSDKKDTDYVTQLDFGKAKYIRAWKDNGTSASTSNVRIFQHKLTPNPAKVLKSVSITTVGQEINVFAITGMPSNSGLVVNCLDETMKKIEETEDTTQKRQLIDAAATLISIIEERGIGHYNSDVYLDYKEAIATLKEDYIDVESVDCNTDIDNRNITVKFTGEIAEDSFTKDYFKLTKDGNIYTDYTIEKVSDKEALIKFANKFDYDAVYAIEISKDIKNKKKTIALDVAYIKEYDGLEAVEADVTYADGKINVNVKNNTDKEQNVTVMIGSYNEFNALVNFELLEDKLNSGDVLTENKDFDAMGGKVQCVVTDTLDDAKLLYGEINLQ